MTMGGSSCDPERGKSVRGPFGPDRPPAQNLNFRLKQLSKTLEQGRSYKLWQPCQHDCYLCNGSGLAG